MLFSKDNAEISSLRVKLEVLEGKIKVLESSFDDLTQKFRSLRGLVNKKLYDDVDDDEEIVRKGKKEDLNNTTPKFI